MKKLAIASAVTLLSTAAYAETYRLVHAIGNTEKELARDLQKSACETMKAERIKLVRALGVGGSITCLPESLFED